MRMEPGKAPLTGEKYIGIFKRVKRGVYILTKYGRDMIENRGTNV